MSFTPITDHVQRALNLLLTQFQGKPNITALVNSFVGSVQDVENIIDTMNTLMSLAVAYGQQLDNLGKIIGLARPPGDDDNTYRMKLFAEIKINVSDGQPEQIIQTYQLFTSAPLIIYAEFYPAEFIVESIYIPPDQATVDLLIQILNEVAPTGVRPYGIVSFDPTEAFAYDGSLPGLGYGTTGDPFSGGKYPVLYLKNGFFEYDGNDSAGLGYGSVNDPLVGGEYAS